MGTPMSRLCNFGSSGSWLRENSVDPDRCAQSACLGSRRHLVAGKPSSDPCLLMFACWAGCCRCISIDGVQRPIWGYCINKTTCELATAPAPSVMDFAEPRIEPGNHFWSRQSAFSGDG